ncbi:MAG: PQQ-binding-like beta-propeller repeat protein [Pseudomonadales bacterium]|jgi:polyvinyl alcohol dehydrogenase (cytochrome)|nr:PQQ-binding-like beta-propeller repeat protein [Pseudomonadales bacterium]
MPLPLRFLPCASALLSLTLAAVTNPANAQQVISSQANAAGQAIYDNLCATCHAMPEATKSPPLDTLRRMGPRAVSYALTNGKMKVQAASLNEKDIDDVVSYLSATADIDNSWIAAHTCPAERSAVDVGKPTIWTQGFDLRNQRRLSAEQAGLTTAQMGKLKLAWSMAFPQTANMRSQPAIVGNTMYYPIVDSGQLFALDIGGDNPCVKWVYEHDVPLRTTIGYHTLADGTPVLVLADAAAHVLLINAISAAVLWDASVKITSVSNVTAMPVLYGDRVFVPISSGELNMGAAPDYECCTSHGAVVALDAKTGARLWVYHTMEDAKPTSVSRVGTQLWGPSGAPIWTAAAIDEQRGLIYVGTGENTSAPATDTSDAVLALRMEDGSLAWKFQATANDIFLTGCTNDPNGPNCPPDYSINKDWDFGAAIMLAQRNSGPDLVVAGQKSGVVWALDPDTGELVWNTKVGPGGAMGGIHWAMAFDGQRLFAGNNLSTGPTADGAAPGLYALDINTGTPLWSYLHQPDCSGNRQQELRSCGSNYGMSAATLLVDGAVIQGSSDGFVKVFDATRGEPLFSFDTARSFDTFNGVKGHGGAIDNFSIWAANGTLFVQSGYGLMGVPGNVLLAFKPAP